MASTCRIISLVISSKAGSRHQQVWDNRVQNGCENQGGSDTRHLLVREFAAASWAAADVTIVHGQVALAYRALHPWLKVSNKKRTGESRPRNSRIQNMTIGHLNLFAIRHVRAERVKFWCRVFTSREALYRRTWTQPQRKWRRASLPDKCLTREAKKTIITLSKHMWSKLRSEACK